LTWKYLGLFAGAFGTGVSVILNLIGYGIGMEAIPII